MSARKVILTRGNVQIGAFPLVDGEPTVCNLRVTRGDTFSESIQFLDGSSGLPIPLLGTWNAVMRQDPNASSPLATFVCDLTQAANGTVTLSLDAPTTTLLSMGGVWDLQETDPAGVVTTWLMGTVAYIEDVTH
jgi:hypothetical protein